LIDLDNDNKPEIIVSFSSARGYTADWVFKWTGTDLNLVGPAVVDTNGDISTVLNEALFIDLDGDGILEIVNSALDTDVFEIFKFDGSHYNFLRDVNFFGVFVRHTGAPTVSTRSFTVLDTDISYILKIRNGDSKGNNRVSNAVIKLNEVVVAGPKDFNQKVSEIVIPVTLQTSNEISVELRSAPGSQITIFVEPQS
jgi:hypothetical protein